MSVAVFFVDIAAADSVFIVCIRHTEPVVQVVGVVAWILNWLAQVKATTYTQLIHKKMCACVKVHFNPKYVFRLSISLHLFETQ